MDIAWGGIVFGATIDDDFVVRHISIESIDDLPKLRGSKYVQSQIGNIYSHVRKELRNGRKVLFSGTGCQVAGLYKFLNKRYDGYLYTSDLVCHGVPSQKTFSAYLKKLKYIDRPKGRNIGEFRFRKLDNWDYRTAVKFSESKWRILDLEENAYMQAFFDGSIFRESCYRCQYRNTKRVGTFTLADFWGIGRHGKSFSKNVASGVSLVIDNEGLLPKLREELLQDAYIEERSMEEAVFEQSNLQRPVDRPASRDVSIKLMLDENTSLKTFCQHCGLEWKNTTKHKMKKFAKDMIYALGMYNACKTIAYKLGKS